MILNPAVTTGPISWWTIRGSGTKDPELKLEVPYHTYVAVPAVKLPGQAPYSVEAEGCGTASLKGVGADDVVTLSYGSSANEKTLWANPPA